ncbi:hypothetical protein [Fictibacillus barbaricus]|uniref:Uncharacterized protein n=1 Tax=Fictibacillus barbaricus TaxID=182136 RepID=A0ABS2ZGB4_9BACL|nr:hypothetical protein [Fictibacillus barbaricus]MBN3546702.1 hypothetical protein [Fictibacillus barbaricus]GGB43136.1 hypothetical protein GCM10007199_05570 [Fictibacillus barbaricus]
MGNELFAGIELSISAAPFYFMFAEFIFIGLILHLFFSKLPKKLYDFLVSCSLLGGAVLWFYLIFVAEWFPLYQE